MVLTGLDIYNFIKSNLGSINFNCETYTDEKSVENINKYKDLLELLLNDINNSYNQTVNRSESSAREIQKALLKVLFLLEENIADYKTNEEIEKKNDFHMLKMELKDFMMADENYHYSLFDKPNELLEDHGIHYEMFVKDTIEDKLARIYLAINNYAYKNKIDLDELNYIRREYSGENE